MQFRNNRRFSERRKVLTAGLAAMLPVPVVGQIDSNPEVVIIGAGAAGLAVARTLMSLGRTVVLVEASHRIGGRAYTDSTTFGVPFDTGAHWLHYGAKNPYYQFAKARGYDIYAAPENYRLFAGNQEVDEKEFDTLWNTYDSVVSAISKAGKAGKDISAKEATKDIKNRWANTAKFILGAWGMGKDFDDFSTLDWWNSPDESDYFCSQGYGTLVADYGRDLPVSFDTTVTKIDWSGKNVTVETTKGKLTAKAVIITVSTGVLASNGIQFVPKLPLAKRESFDAISMGEYDHIALQFSEDIFGMGADGYLLYQIGDDGKGFGTLSNASGSGLAYCDVGGEWARQLMRETEHYRIDYALSQLRSLLGNEVDRAFVKGVATSWGLNRWTRGSYASANPGSYKMRQKLREQVGGRVYFAGEACHRSLWATVGGAHLSGVETARELSRNLG